MNGPRIVAFTGPTLEAGMVIDALGTGSSTCRVLGPACQGDIIRACRLGAEFVLLIDGYFQSVPAVSHKEILWALSRGVHVLGAASMGALRAAELHTYGMIGVGSIFESFRDGVLVRDDEVAVAHSTAEYGHRSMSEALVNVRATMSAAESAGAVNAEDAVTVVTHAAAMFYPDRNWPAILRQTQGILDASASARLADFLRSGGRVDEKRTDAVALIDHVRKLTGAPASSSRVNFNLQHTVWFDKIYRTAGEFVSSASPGNEIGPSDTRTMPTPGGVAPADIRITLGDVIDELRLARRYRPILRIALLRRLATDEAERRGVRISANEVARYADDIYRDIGISDQLDLKRWLECNGLASHQFDHLVKAELRSNAVLADFHRDASGELIDVLRLTGMWPTISDRAARKVALLDQEGLADPGLDNTPFADEAQLLTWWLAGFAPASRGSEELDYLGRSADFGDSLSFLQVLVREYCAQSLGLEPLG